MSIQETHQHLQQDKTQSQRGSAFVFCLVLAGTTAAVLSAFLGRTLVEHNRVQQRSHVERAKWRSVGEIEIAKHVIHTAGYTAGMNDAIADALSNNPSFIDGTSVLIEPAGPARWYRMISSVDYEGANAMTVTYVRDGTTYAVYNYYVESQSLGISGETDGRIHSNEKVELHFEDGSHSGSVSSVSGFEFLNGATQENTNFYGEANPADNVQDVLQEFSFADFEASAVYVAPAATAAEVVFQGTTVEVSLYSDAVGESLLVGVGDSPESFSAIGSGPETPETPISVTNHALDGLFYFPGDIRSVKGDVNGHVTLVSEGTISITDDVRYLDSNGETALLNGSDGSQPYTPNPQFIRDHSLALIADADIRYEPANATLEVNGALVSVNGTVSFEGIDPVGTDGTPEVSGDPIVMDLIRRMGCILSYKRPVVSVLDSNGDVIHGFESGQARFDSALRISPPPSFPEQPKPQFWYSYSLDSTSTPDAGAGEVAAGIILLDSLRDTQGAKDIIDDLGAGSRWDDWDALDDSGVLGGGSVEDIDGGTIGGSEGMQQPGQNP